MDVEGLPGPPKVSKIKAQYPNTKSIGSIESNLLGILEVQVRVIVSDSLPDAPCPLHGGETCKSAVQTLAWGTNPNQRS